MDTDNEHLATMAISIGLYQMFYNFHKVYNSSEPEEHTVEYVVSGVIASLLWTVCISSERDQIFRSYIRPLVYLLVRIHY